LLSISPTKWLQPCDKPNAASPRRKRLHAEPGREDHNRDNHVSGVALSKDVLSTKINEENKPAQCLPHSLKRA
jgi:hypothetical protein